MHDVPPNEANDLWALRERAKELRCLYSVISALSRREEPPNVVFGWILEAIPPAWQYPEDTTARIEYFGRTHARAERFRGYSLAHAFPDFDLAYTGWCG